MSSEKISTKDVLKVIGISSLVMSSLIFPNLPVAISGIYKQWKNANRSYLGRIIKRLEKQQLIRISENDQSIIIEITEKGRNRLLEYNYGELSIKNKKHDGNFRLIIFDIPEEKKRERDSFRIKLVQMGIIHLQDSVFVCAFPCKNEIDFLCHFLEISDFVTVIKISNIERGEKLAYKKFRYTD